MRPKILPLILTFLLASLAWGISWDNDSGDDLWDTASNWSGDSVPTSSDPVYIDINNEECIVSSDIDADANSLSVGTYANPCTITVNGTLETGYNGSFVLGDDSSAEGIMYVESGSYVHGRFMHVGDYGTGKLYLNGGELNFRKRFFVPNNNGGTGEVYLNAGEIIANDMVMRPRGGTGTLDIDNGVLTLRGDQTSDMNTYLSNGWITAFNGNGGGEVSVSYDSGDDETTLEADPCSADFTNNATNNRWRNHDNWDTGRPGSITTVEIDVADATCLIDNVNAESSTLLLGINNSGCELKVTNDKSLDAGDNGICLGDSNGSEGILTITSGIVEARFIHCGENGEGNIKMTGGVLDLNRRLFVPKFSGGTGHVQLDGGTIKAARLEMRINGGVGTMEITGGKLELAGDERSNINSDISNGYITAGDGGQLIVDYDSGSNITTVQASTLDFDVQPPTALYYTPYFGTTDDEWVSTGTLQGILAQDGGDGIYMWKDGVSSLWMNDLANNYNVTLYDVRDYRGNDTSFEWLVDHFKDKIKGYILYDESSNHDSLDVAVSLSGLFDAIAVDDDLESTVQSLGIPKVLDVSSRDTQWLINNYFDQLNSSAIIVKNNDHDDTWMCQRLRDLGAALRCVTTWEDSTSITGPLYDDIAKNSPVLGWADGAYSNEGDFIEYHSEHDLYQLPADGATNLSIFAGMNNYSPEITFDQNLPDSYTQEDNVHHVTFIHSDMDNVNLLLSQDWATGSERYGNSNRGDFAFGWGMSPSMVQLAPNVMKWWYDDKTSNDCFVAPFSGTGYFHPSEFSSDAMNAHVNQLEELMEDGDLKSVVINDPDAYAGGVMSKWDDISYAEGFFVTGGPYHEYGDDIRWSNGKPFVSIKYSMWDGYESPSSLASAINGRSTNANNEDAYTAVIVHAWSYDFDDVDYCVSLLDNDVRVVTPEEFIEQIKMHDVGK